ncbi:MAG: DHHW family protein [Oscillospiraceae bacterium]|nr:DHHW family protein [Oscillospiraceae bacterium]
MANDKDKNGLTYENICRYALIALCALAAVIVPLYWIFANAPDFYGLEKRYRATWPAFTGDALFSGRWGERVDDWMADNMPAREFFVGIDSYVWYLSGRQAARDVIVDGGGNLVEAPPAYSPSELVRRLNKITEFASIINAQSREEARVTDTVIITPPNAGYIARLPRRIARNYMDDDIAYLIAAYVELVGVGGEGVAGGADDADSAGGVDGVDAASVLGATFDLEDIAGSLGEAGISYVDLRQAFAASDEAVYYRTDHHWNSAGVYMAYSSLGGTLGYEPLPRDAFEIEVVDDFYGSTYAKSGLWLTGPDTIELWAPPCPVDVTVIDAANEPDIRISVFFDEYLTDWDKYSVFLGGIHGLTIIDNLGSVSGADVETGDPRTLFVIKDSYANSLLPLLITHFDKIVAVDLRHYRGTASELLQEYGSDAPGSTDVVLYVYSMNHIANDTDILWLR